LKPTGSKGAKASGDEKEKNTKAMDGDKKSWKARLAELEAKMVAMNATTNSGGPKPHDTPSFHAGGGSLPDDEEFEHFMLSGMAITAADLTLEAFAHTRSETIAPKEAPRGTSPSLDPQRGEGNKQARLPESFTLGEVVPTSSMVPPIRVKLLQGCIRPHYFLLLWCLERTLVLRWFSRWWLQCVSEGVPRPPML
jgi:hypothetical protein